MSASGLAGVGVADAVGILSISPQITLTFDLPLIGHGKQTSDDCGTWIHKVCPNYKNHPHGLDADKNGKIPVYHYQKSCHRPECPVCHPSWVTRATKRGVYRLHEYQKIYQKKVIHVILSPPKEHLKRFKNYNGLARKACFIAKKYNLIGGSLIYHSKSRQCLNCGSNMMPRKNRCHKCGQIGWKWHFNPHFHYLGFGWLPNWYQEGKNLYKKHQWVVRNLKIRKTIGGTLWYELSHCAYIGEKKTIVRWIGSMSPRKFKPAPMPKEEKRCPICGSKMVSVYQIGGVSLPKFKGIYYLEPEKFRFKFRKKKDAPIEEDNPEEREKKLQEAWEAYSKAFKQ